jgi:integrase
MDALTAREVESAKPTETRQEIPDGYTVGLYLIVQPKPSGAKSWAIRYTSPTKKKKAKLRLGGFPALGLADAREAANAAKALLDRGIDPRTEKAAENSNPTFEEAVADYTEKHVSQELRAGTAQYVKRELGAVTAEWRGRLLRSITKRDVIARLNAAYENGRHAGNTARKVLAAFFTWASGQDLIAISPLEGIKKRPTKARERFLGDGEIRIVWQAADKLGGSYGALAKLLLLTGARRNEIARLTWDEIKADEIVLPPERNKTAEWLHIPLTPLMRSIIKALPRCGSYVLGDGSRPISANMRAKNSLDVQLNEPWRYHDLRRTFITGCARIGVPIQVVEKCVAHKLSGVLGVYQHHDFSAEKREAFMKWSEHIAAITAPDYSQDTPAVLAPLMADLATA